MDLFSVVQLDDPESVAVGVRPLREGEVPTLEATAGRITQLAVQEPEGSPAVVIPIQGVAPLVQPEPTTTPSTPPVIQIDESEEEEEQQLILKRHRSGGDGAEPSKKPRSEAEEEPPVTGYVLCLFILSIFFIEVIV